MPRGGDSANPMNVSRFEDRSWESILVGRSALGRSVPRRHRMTEWNADEYARQSSLQQAMASEVLARLDLQGTERVLDVGCGNGKITAEIAARVPRGSVVGVDPSREMIAFASNHFSPALRPNLRFVEADVRYLPFHDEF